MTQINETIKKLFREKVTVKRGIRNRRQKNKKYDDLSKALKKVKQTIKDLDFLREKINIVQKKLDKNKTKKQQKNLESLYRLTSLLEAQHKTRKLIHDNKNNKKHDNIFDFSDIKHNNNDDEINIGDFLNIVENNIVRFENDDIRGILENIKDNHPFIVKGSLKINDNEPSMINSFFTNRDALNERIDKFNEGYDESIPITFTGTLIKYTKSFNRIHRSFYGAGCNSFKKIIEYKGKLCYIPEENECFRKCLEFISTKDLTEEYRDFIKNSKRSKNIMTSARIQPFCKKYNINLGVYNLKHQEILPPSVTEKRICLYIHENHFCLIWRTKNTNFTHALKELKDNFKYETNQISDNILKQVQQYKFPISNEKDCLYAVFAFDIETVNVDYKQYCIPYAAGCYHLDRLKECYNGDLFEEELKIEKQQVHIFVYKN